MERGQWLLRDEELQGGGHDLLGEDGALGDAGLHRLDEQPHLVRVIVGVGVGVRVRLGLGLG